ncbi:nudix hydrolase 13, mitochondrial isoform X1 [Pyrus x bretschneideri]|uniref:nudix hydrolase 13, mitochondrial isoform X1 n=1 Tax=Pyrus x bretschneideri TaxID=225117 RepID=UPI00202F9241|nr:nudix hydrolase 13, mitochondrial isoform X1 [Pyrus x bretschneideri]
MGLYSIHTSHQPLEISLLVIAQLKCSLMCIPYRFEKSDGSIEQKLLVLMISSPSRDDLVFPKGGWEDDETMSEAACREALEEAGVKGVLGDNPLGAWEYRSKSKQKSCSLQGGCKGFMFAMEVTEELDSWPEQANYGRKWLTIEEAFRSCRYDWMREALRKFATALSETRENDTRKELDELPLRPISEIGSEHPMSSSSTSFANHTSIQQLAA